MPFVRPFSARPTLDERITKMQSEPDSLNARLSAATAAKRETAQEKMMRELNEAFQQPNQYELDMLRSDVWDLQFQQMERENKDIRDRYRVR